MKLKQPELRRARIEIIPMIDTIFFLLVFFMITWIAMVKMNGMGTVLPKPATPGAVAPYTVILSLASSGQYYIDKKKTTETQWADTLRGRLAADPNSLIVVNVAPTQKTQTLISIMDTVNGLIANTHGHAQVVIATSKADAVHQEASHVKER